MAHFYGSMQGNRGSVTRTGSKDSGLSAHIRGWDFGVSVRTYVNQDGVDCVCVSLTGGSNDPTTIKTLYNGAKPE